MLRILLILLVYSACLQASTETQVLPVFPGAEGFGTRTSGGRGGIVCKVTNLNDKGEGSLRNCIDTTKPRIIVFTTSGIIRLESSLVVRHPYLSIFGQTAPGDGILITGVSDIQQALVTIATHDVVMQHLRFHTRQGDEHDCCSHTLSITKADNRDPLSNIVLDHCSFSGGTAGIISDTDDADNITLSHNIIGSGRKLPVTEKENSVHEGVVFNASGTHDISLHHNLIVHSQSSNPSINTGSGKIDIVNNLIYNWGQNGTQIVSKHGKIQANLVHNLYIMGADSIRDAPDDESAEISVRNAGKDYQLFLEENLSIRDPEQPEPLPVKFSMIGWPTANWESSERLAAPPITTFKSQTLLDKILPSVGATLPHRDAIDQALIENTRQNQGNIPPCSTPTNCLANTNATALYTNESPTPDKDDDGIPDTWELANSLNPDKQDATEDYNLNGYTNIEEWIFSLTPSTTLAQHQQKVKTTN